MEQNRCYGCMRPKDGDRFCPHCGYDSQLQNAPHQLPAGTVLKGQYLVGRVLGQGGFGITYLGWDLYLEIPVAIKEYYPSSVVMRENTRSLSVINCEERAGSTFESNRRRFLREAQSLAQLSHVPEVVQVRNFFPENETAYIVMEYISGVTLKEQLQKYGPMESGQVLKLMRPVLEGLKQVHSVGLVHRDISPDNIMFLPNGRVKLLDFGSVRDMDSESSTQAILKPAFAPIEQYKSRGNLGPWTDIYGLCVTMYYCMTGRVPVDAPKRMMDQCGIGWENVPGLTNAQIEALNRGTELLPQNRLQSVEELMQLLYTQPGAAPVPTPSPEAIPVTVPLVREEASAAGEDCVTIPLSRNEEPAVQKAEPLPVTRNDKWEDPAPRQKYIAEIETMKTLPLDRAGMAEPISYTAPVNREEAQRNAAQQYGFDQRYEETPRAVPQIPREQVSWQAPPEAQTVPSEPVREKSRKKKNPLLGILIALVLVAAALAVAFFTVHIWEDATCTSAKTCTICGKTEGASLGHSWQEATCTEPEICTRCDKTKGEALGHSMKDATCTDPSTCRVCGETEGSELGHTWSQATCTEPKTCIRCNATDGAANGHSLKEATCTSAAVCSVCGAQEGSALGHNWTAATYTAPKTCSRCGKTEGTVKGYIASVSGNWERVHKGNTNTSAFVFTTPVKGCRSLVLTYKPTFNSNSYVDEWKFYYKNSSGNWVYYQNFTTNSGNRGVKFTFDPKVTIHGVLVIPVKAGSYSYSFSLSVTDVYGDG